MSRGSVKIKGYRLPEVEKRPLSNKFTHVINAGMATAGPPLGPLLGKYGINIGNFCKDFNEKTKGYIKGIPLPCIITVNPDRTYKINFMKPPTQYYLKQAAGVESFVREEGAVVGKITLKHLYEIAKIKHEDPYAYYQLDDLQDVCKKIIDKARENGIQVVKDLDANEYQQFLSERKTFIKEYEEKMEAEKQARLLRA